MRLHSSRLAAVSLVFLGLGACAPLDGRGQRRPDLADHGDDEVSATARAIDDGWARTDGWAIAPLVRMADGATRVSAMVTMLAADAPSPTLETRGALDGRTVTDWIPLTVDFEDAEARVLSADLGVTVDAIELRVREADLESITDLRFSGADPALVLGASDDEEAISRAPLRSELQGLGIVTREEWGARRGTCTSRDGARRRISIHHTEGGATDPARQLRGVQSYHQSRGWCDVGYHFLIGSDGRIYEGRPVELLGAHVRDNNSGNLGIAFIGCFDPHECSSPTPITEAMIDAAGRLIGTLGDLYGITISSSTVRGHRDQVSTTCPGDHLESRIGDLIAIGRTSRLGETTPPAAPPPSDPPADPGPSGRTCRHSFGGTYAASGCSESYQCCDGAWRSRSSGCGACVCVESTGSIGCTGTSAPPADPPPSDPAPSTGLPYAGLTLSGSEIPRAGLANPTLRATLGLSTEPHGTTTTYEGASFVRGRVSWFGGPADTGVTSTETGSISGERLRSLNDPISPSASTLRTRPEAYYYVAMRWAYAPNGTRWWRDARLLIVNPATGAAIVVRPVDWGPNTSTRRILDLSPQALSDLGLSTDGEAIVAFAPTGTPLGRVR